MQANLMIKTDFDDKVSGPDSKITPNETKKWIYWKELKRLEEGLLFILGKILFDGGDSLQDYLIFQPVHRYIKIITSTKHISSWKCKGLSDESIKPITTSDNTLSPLIYYYSNKMLLLMSITRKNTY